MLLEVKPYHKNSYPLGGILLKGATPLEWAVACQRIGIPLHTMEAYAIPGVTANTTWGCLLTIKGNSEPKDIGKNEYCQLVKNKVFIPCYSVLYPFISDSEVDRIFGPNRFFFHPETGFVELEEQIDWVRLLTPAVKSEVTITKPVAPVFVPSKIKSYEIVVPKPEDVIKNMEEKIFPEKKEFNDKPLNAFEKFKLEFYRLLLKGANNEAGNKLSPFQRRLLSAIDRIAKPISKPAERLSDKMQTDMEDLERRNQNQVDKLLDLFKNNPEEALKYAIPLNDDGAGRGPMNGLLDLSKKWNDFSLTGGLGSGGGGGTLEMEAYNRLVNQYTKTAEELIKQGEYHKAAFVYLKLLKNKFMAAQTLEQGKLYSEAAAIYIKHLDNKKKAAECYEKGNMTTEAIALYKELKEYEKVGDLYNTLNQKAQADEHYKIVVDDYAGKSMFVKAAVIEKNKIGDTDAAQTLLIEGWHKNRDALNCLRAYFANITQNEELAREIERLHRESMTSYNYEAFLSALKYETERDDETVKKIREIAYEIIAAMVEHNPAIISDLRFFNKQNDLLLKDILKYKQNIRSARK